MDILMDQQTLEDLLALIQIRNVSLAAKQRNVSQSAYSRRLQAIEHRHGITLFDRSRRPARPSPILDAMQADIEVALNTLKRVDKLLSSGIAIEGNLTIAAMHSLSTGALPVALKRIAPILSRHPIRLRSANRDGCFQLLMTGEVSLMVSYETDAKALRAPSHLVSTTRLSSDAFVPVCCPELMAELLDERSATDVVPLLAYPSDVFLGTILSEDILSRSPRSFAPRLTTGMTSVLLSAAINGIGMAWLPASTVGEAIHAGRLQRLSSPDFPEMDLQVTMLRLRTPGTPELDALVLSLGNAITHAIKQLSEGRMSGNQDS
jgi:DNA-binding transcriptional LysR family regulator